MCGKFTQMASWADIVSWKIGETPAEAMERTGGEAYGLADTVTVSGIVADVQAQEARALEGQAQLVETDAPNLWIALFAVGGLVLVAALWRLRL